MNEKLRVGLVSFFHNNARGDIEIYERVVSELHELKNKLDFELFVSEKRVYTFMDAEEAVEELNQANLDFCLLFCASVANGEAVIPFRLLQCRIGIWSVPEPVNTGYLPINSFCGTMILSGILGNYLKESDIQFKWFYGFCDHPLFIDRFKITVSALKAIKKIDKTKVALIGPTVRGFDHLIVNDAQLLQKYGIHTDRFISLEDVIAAAKEIPVNSVENELRQMAKNAVVSKQVDSDILEKSARLKLALEKMTADNHYDMLAVSCWTKLQDLYGVAACSSLSQLNNENIITACEGDIDGAIGMYLTNCFSKEISTMVDIVNFDETDDSLNLWHCGPSAKCLADEKGVYWDNHFDIGEKINGEWHGCGTVASLKFKPGRITISRLSTRTNELLILKGEVTTKETYQGSSAWVNQVMLGDRKLSIPEIITLLLETHADHHVVFGYGDMDSELREFAFWKDINLIKYRPYLPYLESF